MAENKQIQDFWFSISEENHDDIFMMIPANSKEQAEKFAIKATGLNLNDEDDFLILKSLGNSIEGV